MEGVKERKREWEREWERGRWKMTATTITFYAILNGLMFADENTCNIHAIEYGLNFDFRRRIAATRSVFVLRT